MQRSSAQCASGLRGHLNCEECIYSGDVPFHAYIILILVMNPFNRGRPGKLKLVNMNNTRVNARGRGWGSYLALTFDRIPPSNQPRVVKQRGSFRVQITALPRASAKDHHGVRIVARGREVRNTHDAWLESLAVHATKNGCFWRVRVYIV